MVSSSVYLSYFVKSFSTNIPSLYWVNQHPILSNVSPSAYNTLSLSKFLRRYFNSRKTGLKIAAISYGCHIIGLDYTYI